MTDFIQTDDYQWLRTVDTFYVDDTYEMYQIQKAPEYVEREFWYAGGGEFSLADYKDDIDYDINVFGYESVAEIKRIYGDHWERIVAECVFECNWADFDLECFDTLDEAQAYVNKLMEG